VKFGLPVKHFASFTEACNEAAISRLYGGIHYMAAIENGQKQGRDMGKWILQKIRLMYFFWSPAMVLCSIIVASHLY